MLVKILNRCLFEIFFLIFSYFFQKIGFDNSCKLSPEETIFCMNCQILFSGENKKNIISLSSDKFAQRIIKVKIRTTPYTKMLTINGSLT